MCELDIDPRIQTFMQNIPFAKNWRSLDMILIDTTEPSKRKR